MSDTIDPDFIDIDPRFYELVGRISSDWAFLEILLSDCIWSLSGSPYGAGACVTSQIYTFDAKMKAFIALLRLKNVDSKFIAQVNKFHEKSRSAQSARNRAIHDVWGYDEGETKRVILTADKKLIFEMIPVTPEDLENDLDVIEQTILEFYKIRSTLTGFLLTLPDTYPLRVHATYIPRKLKQTPSIQPQ